ncbi:MAG TPA: DEAD/DEAH box helicase family protein [Chitinophagales bacterium]|nr:DEAD/DEAH box helicase family protein [Chitinophagales bacterium]
MKSKYQKEINILNIWDHQKDAIQDISEYLKSKSDKSFLVKMPTGTGKTGVFASLTRIANPNLNYLIITPSTALKFQIIDELKTEFWKKIGYDESKLKEQFIDSLIPTTFTIVKKEIENKKFIIVTTIQALQAIASNNSIEKEYEEFQNKVGCIIFDEGHKEPAYTWGETVRAFKKPTILFSATPYRNDYKVFNIDKEKFFSIEHDFCTKQNFLRNLEIKEINESPYTIGTYLSKLLVEIDKIRPEILKQGISNPKIIIRCENADDIKKIVNTLIKSKKRVIGIHENFKPSIHYCQQVPKKNDQEKYDFFVHQYKLIEGIDNPSFCIVSIFSDFRSSRLLIQQVGRILRNPKRLPNQKAFLFCRNKNKINAEWEKYLQYDKLLDKRKKLFDISDILKVNKDVSTLYFEGTFRDLINVNNVDLKTSILFQKKVNVFINNGTANFSDLSQILIDEWNSRDYHVLKTQFIGTDTLLILYIKYENSPLVKSGVFIEQTLAITFLKFKQNYIYYYDSIQSSPMRQIENLKPISREFLVRLFKDKRSINKVFLMNTDIGANNIRNKELHAGAVEYTAPGLSDYSYFPARIEGNIISKGSFAKRYIGFQNGRITDFTNFRIEFEEFIEWINEIHKDVLTTTTYNKIDSFLNRFSEKVNPPSNPIATSILLDIDDEILFRYGFGQHKIIVELEDYCAVINSGHFILTFNGHPLDVYINYDTKQERFILSSSEINNEIQNLNDNESTLLGYINSNQSFRIVLSGNEYVYAHKNFFKPSLNLTSKKQSLDLNQLFHVYPNISNIESEKGNSHLKISSNLWDKETLFGLIARQGKGYGDKNLESEFNFEYLLCDDLSSEIGDFIGLDTKNKRVVFMHAKAKKSKISATNFTEVCGQATKNLDYLTPYYQRTPKQNIDKWKQPWTLSTIGTVSNRIITNNANSKQFWDKYIDLISDPNTKREVWLIVGNMFDHNAFKSELKKTDVSKIKSEVIQLIYLLRSTWNSVSQVGAQLKIFC